MSDKKDAERFRWLLKQVDLIGSDMVCVKWQILVDKAGIKGGGFYDHGTFRNCIDKAMKEKL